MSENTLKVRLIHPCKTDAEWASSNPVAKKGEIMISSDKSGMFKVGNGTSKWSELGYNHVTWANVEGKPSTYPATAHTHDDRYYTESEIDGKLAKYLPKSGGTMEGTAFISWPDTGNWSNSNTGVTFPVSRGGLQWSGQSDGIQLYAVETGGDNLELYLKFLDDNSNGLSIRNAKGNETARISASGVISASSFIGTLTGDITGHAYGVRDYNNSKNIIQIGYSGDGLNENNLNYVAGYSDNGKKIKDVSKDVLKSWLTISNISNDAGLFNNMVRANHWYQNIVEFNSTETVDEIVIKTHIPFANGNSMILINIRGFAYGEASPVELILAFYIYSDIFCNMGCISTCSWKPTIYLSTYIENSQKYVAISLNKQIYYLKMGISIQDIWWNGSYRDSYAQGWSISSQYRENKTTIIPQTDIVTVPYRPITNDISGNATSATTATTATKLATARTISLTGSVTGSGSFDGSGNLSIATSTNHTHSYSSLTGTPTIGNGTITIKQNGTQKATFTMNQTGNTTVELTDTNTNTWRGIQNNLTSDSTSDSLAAAQGKALKGMVDAVDKKVDGIEIGGRNLARGTSSEWSDWIRPGTGISKGHNFTVITIPGDTQVGDSFTTTIEFEWCDFASQSGQTFSMWSQGSQDGKWSYSNPFANKLFSIKSSEGKQVFRVTNKWDGKATVYDLGIRVDYSDGNGKYRYRFIKAERGNKATDWTPAPEDIDDSISSLSSRITTNTNSISSLKTTVSNKLDTSTFENYKSHTHKSVIDSGNSSSATTFAYSKAGMNYGDYSWLAGWNGYELRAVNKTQFATSGHNHDSVYSKLGHTHTKSQITDFPTLGTAASKNTRTLTSASHSSWVNASTDQGYVPDMAFIAYWNGAFSSNGASNLAYCNRGAFGTIVTKNAGDYATAGHTHNYAGSSSAGGSANSAVKLATARNIKVGGLSNFSFNFDGSGNISVDNWGYGTNKYVTTDSTSAPYFRIAYTETKNNYTDASMILMIDGGNTGGGFGILKVAFRSDNISTIGHSYVELLWLVRKNFELDQFFVKGYNPANETQYADLYFKASGTYNGVVVTALSMGARGSKSRSWTFDSGNPRSAADIRKYSYTTTSSDAGITKTCTGNASTATKLATARSINGTNFDGSGNITTANWGTTRTITIGNTGKSVNGSGNISWSLSEIGAAASSHSHNYAGSSSAGGPATSAVKLDTATAGSATQPVYFSGGKPVACTYTLGKSVPSNAVFTDTNTWRGIQNNLTSDSTSDSLSAAQGKVLKGLVDGKANTSHTHTKSQITDFPSSLPASDVYSWAKASSKPSYSWSEIGSKPSTFTPSSHTHNYLPLSGGTVTGNISFSNNTGITALMAGGTDGWGIVGSGTDDAGRLKIYVSDNGTSDWIDFEFRDYTGTTYTPLQMTGNRIIANCTIEGNISGSAGSVAWTNVSGRPSSLPASDVYAWAKASSKPSYSWGEITGKPSSFTPSSHTHNYLPLSGGTVTGSTTFNNGVTIKEAGLELYYKTPFIDFHYANSTADYTSRIIENAKGVLNINGATFTDGGSVWCTSFSTDGGVNARLESTFSSGTYTDPLPGVSCGIKVSGMATATRFYVRGRSGTWLSSAQPGGAGFECVNDTIDSALIPGWRIRNLSGAWVGASYNMDKAFHLYYAKAERLSGNTDNGTDADFIFNGRTGNFSAKSITQTSDERRKSVISSSILDIYKDFFMKIKPFSFKWKDGQDDTATHLGVGAQSVFHTALECGFEESDIGLVQRGKEYPGTSIPWSVSYTEFIPLNIAVTQDHETRIEKLERENEELKQQIKELKGLTA